MTIDLTKGIVRILKADGTTAGTGFVVSDEGLIATCAHVVEFAGSGPGNTVSLAFRATGERREATVQPDWWCDPEGEDLAILRLKANLPEYVQALPIARSGGSEGHRFKTFGFPPANPEEGIWGSGEILGETTSKGVPMLQLRSPEVTPGFSGAPVWDHEIERVIGMVTAIAPPDKSGRLAVTAFALPIEVLVESWPGALARVLSSAEKDFTRKHMALQEREEQEYQELLERLDRLEEQLRRLTEQRTREPRPIDVLRRVTKLFVGDLAQTLTGEPRKELRQFCLTQASKLPHVAHLDIQYLEAHADELRKLYRTIRVLLEMYRDRPDSTRLVVLQDEGRILGAHLRHIYRMKSGDALDMTLSVTRLPEE